MKTRYFIFIIGLLALTVTGCKKDNNGRIRILTENMTRDSKILINPTEIRHTTWLPGEYIAINGVSHEIVKDDNDGTFYLENVAADGDMLAIYPAGSFGGNDIEIVQNASGDKEVVIKRLMIDFHNYSIEDNEGNDSYYYYYGAESVVFPMAASATASSSQLLFNHLTGGLKITLENNTSSSIDIASIKIVAQSDATVGNLSANGVTARWEVQGPTLPHGEVGGINGDYVAAHACEMNFDFATTRYGWDNSIEDEVLTTTSGITIGSWETSTFCVPITLSSLRYLTVTGYSASGEQLFHETKDLGSDQTIARNTMYTVPTIQIY